MQQFQNTYQTEFTINYMSNGKVMIYHLINWFLKKTLLYKMSYFAEPDNHSKKQIKVELCLHVFLDLSKTWL